MTKNILHLSKTFTVRTSPNTQVYYVPPEFLSGQAVYVWLPRNNENARHYRIPCALTGSIEGSRRPGAGAEFSIWVGTYFALNFQPNVCLCTDAASTARDRQSRVAKRLLRSIKRLMPCLLCRPEVSKPWSRDRLNPTQPINFNITYSTIVVIVPVTYHSDKSSNYYEAIKSKIQCK